MMRACKLLYKCAPTGIKIIIHWAGSLRSIILHTWRRDMYKWTCSVNFQKTHTNRQESALDHDFCMKIDVDFDKVEL